ncbi:VOC family protein [Lysobacter sp. CFH 32150]|uniref:VOC family protein n=1 Tax=Lysobacter sp. CFH 32150 TaxID=2927128 RepID=UPI001FA7FF99|nr:VOC family protein [Lysobacter sp. CFH 32150]MCI4568253.1 VOC family protein [Lysobacter sp. CFH 32150]
MRYLHAMVRVRDLDASLKFYCDGLGLVETRRKDYPDGKYTLVFVAAPQNPEVEIELTHNWPPADGSPTEEYGGARNFGHLAFRVDDIYATCARLQAMGVTINRPPRDGHMAFVRSPDAISIELLQEGRLPPAEPWVSMPNTGSW